MNKSNTSSQIISLPKGGGAQHGLGEKFSPDLHTGTGNFTVPIALPPGRNGFQPQINLIYSTGNGNGLFGLGWSLSIPGVTRKTAKGIPRYQDYDKDLKKRDTFILSGAEDLVPVWDKDLDPVRTTRYRPRTEGLFAKIIHHHNALERTNYWEVRSKDGLVSYYGPPPAEEITYHADFQPPKTPATIIKPKLTSADLDRVFAWKLTLTKDPFDNRIEYVYGQRDEATDRDKRNGHEWDQPLLTQIRYADYTERNATKFLVTVTFVYEDRPDAFSDYRAGFEIRTSKRCKEILIETHADRRYKVRRYEFSYTNQSETLNGVSELRAIDVVGFDDAGTESRDLSPLEFGYTDFKPQDEKKRDFYPVQGPDLPASSLANSSVELVDLFGNGLPDILEMNGTVRYWRNRGGGQFDLPRPMNEAPAGLTLASAGVQMIDANGDGRTDLLVTDGPLTGYYPLKFGGLWDRRSFQKYAYAPSFDLKDPEVRLLDLTGDGVTDVIRSGARFECFFNDPHEGWKETRWVERNGLDGLRDLTFSDPRVKWADMSGDGMQDIVLVYDGNVEYWPNLGYGSWGKRIHMENSPRFPYGYDPKRILLGDVDGDGLADLLYIDDRKVTLWINQSGNGWSDPIEIPGTPPVSDMDAVRLIDLLGSGISGVLWTKDAAYARQDHYFFLDLTGGVKPYLLSEMNNNMGAVTKVAYAPSTRFYQEDEKRKETRWRTPLPFPVQVVARVEVIDELSKGKLTTEYRYHHGYWDGGEREFRGFGMVEQLDTEVFSDYHRDGLHGTAVKFDKVDEKHFAPPTLTKTWFHQGPVGEELGEWQELDLSNEYWNGDPQLLEHTDQVKAFLKTIDSNHAVLTTRERRAIKRDALRTLRGSILRTELYALDGSPLQDRPYTVTEQAYGLQEIEPPGVNKRHRLHIFFPHSTAQRTTQWERGDDPMTQFSFTGEYDEFGQPLSQSAVAPPRRLRKRLRPNANEVADEIRMLATHSRTTYGTPTTGEYIHGRVAHGTSFELNQPPEITETDSGDVKQILCDQKDAARQLHQRFETDLEDWRPESTLLNTYRIIAHAVNRYDGDPYKGLNVGRVGKRGALTLSETLVFTDDIRRQAYGTAPLIDGDGKLVLPAGAPAGFGTDLGYRHVVNEEGFVEGFYAKAQQQKFDFHDSNVLTNAGLVIAQKDPLGHETKIVYDRFGVLPETVEDPVGLRTKAEYNHRVMQPERVTDPNGNVIEFRFSPIGLPTESWIKGKLTQHEGDRVRPSTKLTYNFLAFWSSKQRDPAKPKPIVVRTIRQVRHDTDPDDAGDIIETREYSDGFGRLLQTRTQGEDIRSGDPIFGGGEEVLPAKQSDGRGNSITDRRNTSSTRPNVIVSGWQSYDNKGRVVEKYEPFFDVGWNYDPPEDAQLGQKVSIFYDPRGQVIRTVNSDGSEQRVIYGVPVSLSDPPLGPKEASKFSPTPWEAYTYDANDNAGRTHATESQPYRHHYNTPSSILIDALGRTILAVVRTRNRATTTTGSLLPIEEYRTRSTYDIQGNLLTITDALDRKAFAHVYDLTKRVLRIESIDAGIRRIAVDAIGNKVQGRDSKGATTLHEYDELNRPKMLWARDKTEANITLREELLYGDEGNRTTARQNNTLGKPVEHFDEAGVLNTPKYDFKGNLLEKTRKVIGDDTLATGWIADWTKANADADLDNAVYTTDTEYDALNRPTLIQYPADVDGDRAILKPTYNRAGALEQVSLDGDVYVQRIAYNAKGQRGFIVYGNGIFTRYAYDTKIFRLKRLRSEHYSRTGNNYQPNGTLLQDLAYDYDVLGNILGIHDRVPACGLPNDPNKFTRSFEYNSLYRLTSATGRECNLPPATPIWEDSPRCQDVTSTRPYRQNYIYDPAGNLTALRHVAPNNGSFTRTFDTVSGNNRLETVSVGTKDYEYMYDDNGNMIQETLSRVFKWDHADRWREFQETAGANASKQARYLYDSAGMRVKKWVRKNGNNATDESTVYVDGLFEHHRWTKTGGGQNNHLHIMDNQSRVAILRMGNIHPDDAGPAVQYHLGDHLGSSAIVVDENGELTNREEFFPYGETSFGSFARKRYRFTVKERDEESGLSYHGARYYVPWLGRWSNCDPAGIITGLNLFEYARNCPLVLVDKTGLATGPPPTDTGNKVKVGNSGQGGSYNELKGVKINGNEPTIREHCIPGAQCQSLTMDPLTGEPDYHNHGPEYRADDVYLNPAEDAKKKTHKSGEYSSDNARTEQVKQLQKSAAEGKGRGATLNKDLIIPSIEHAVETGTTREVATRAALKQAGNLFSLQSLQETGQKLAERLKTMTKSGVATVKTGVKAASTMVLTVGWDLVRKINGEKVRETMQKLDPTMEDVEFMEDSGYTVWHWDAASGKTTWRYEPSLSQRTLDVVHEILTSEITTRSLGPLTPWSSGQDFSNM